MVVCLAFIGVAGSAHAAEEFDATTLAADSIADRGWPSAILEVGVLALLALLIAGFFVFRRRWVKARARQGITTIWSPSEAGIDHVVPRYLPGGAFYPEHSHLSLSERIELAARQSKQWGSTLGVLYTRVEDYYAEIERARGVDAARAAIEALATELRQRMRPSDYVGVLGHDQIIICACLIENTSVLDRISERLAKVIDGAKSPLFAGMSKTNFGSAIYPLGGYTGRDLISTAARGFGVAKGFIVDEDARLLSPASIEQTHAPSAPRGRRALASALEPAESRKRSNGRKASRAKEITVAKS